MSESVTCFECGKLGVYLNSDQRIHDRNEKLVRLLQKYRGLLQGTRQILATKDSYYISRWLEKQDWKALEVDIP